MMKERKRERKKHRKGREIKIKKGGREGRSEEDKKK